MPDTQCTISMLGVPVPVTVSWCVERCQGEYGPEIEVVVSDVLGDITDRVLNDLCGEGFWLQRQGEVGWKPRPAWVPYDPILCVLFGQAYVYERGDSRIRSEAQPHDHPVKCGSEGGRMMGAVTQHERTVPRLVAHGTLAHQIYDLVMDTDQWWEAVRDYEQWLMEV